MEKQSIKWSIDGDPSLLVIEVPADIGPFGISSSSFAIPIMKRRGGLLVAMPMHAVDSDKLVDEMQNEGEGLLGPSKSFIAELMAEGEGGAPVLVGTQCRFMVIDFSDEILLVTKEYVPEEDDLPWQAFLTVGGINAGLVGTKASERAGIRWAPMGFPCNGAMGSAVTAAG